MDILTINNTIEVEANLSGFVNPTILWSIEPTDILVGIIGDNTLPNVVVGTITEDITTQIFTIKVICSEGDCTKTVTFDIDVTDEWARKHPQPEPCIGSVSIDTSEVFKLNGGTIEANVTGIPNTNLKYTWSINASYIISINGISFLGLPLTSADDPFIEDIGVIDDRGLTTTENRIEVTNTGCFEQFNTVICPNGEYLDVKVKVEDISTGCIYVSDYKKITFVDDVPIPLYTFHASALKVFGTSDGDNTQYTPNDYTLDDMYPVSYGLVGFRDDFTTPSNFDNGDLLGHSRIIEDSPFDSVWDANGSSQNLPTFLEFETVLEFELVESLYVGDSSDYEYNTDYTVTYNTIYSEVVKGVSTGMDGYSGLIDDNDLKDVNLQINSYDLKQTIMFDGEYSITPKSLGIKVGRPFEMYSLDKTGTIRTLQGKGVIYEVITDGTDASLGFTWYTDIPGGNGWENIILGDNPQGNSGTYSNWEIELADEIVVGPNYIITPYIWLNGEDWIHDNGNLDNSGVSWGVKPLANTIDNLLEDGRPWVKEVVFPPDSKVGDKMTVTIKRRHYPIKDLDAEINVQFQTFTTDGTTIVNTGASNVGDFYMSKVKITENSTFSNKELISL